MDALTISAASGLRSRMDTLDLLANNLANAETSGYKTDREFYGLFVSPEASSDIGGEFVTTLPVVERQWTDFSQGTLTSTGSPLDVGLSGRGFLAVNGPSGALYTRNGHLKISPSGELVTGDDYPVRSAGTNGKTIHVTSDKPIDISPDGTVRQDGQTLGQLEIMDFPSSVNLKKMTAAAFQNTDPANVPAPATNVQVEQGKVETSNVAVPEAAMRLVNVMRQFEMLQKAVNLDSQMEQQGVQEVARVTS
jgi:flagellar basal body rod protein FlgG